MGLFENPYPAAPENQWKKLIHSPEAVKLSRDLDKESIVLLENHNATLPLKKSGNIAVIGPMAHGFMNVSQVTVIGMIGTGKIHGTNEAFSTVTMLSIRVSTGVSLPLTVSRLLLATRLRSTMPRDVSDGAMTSQVSTLRLRLQRSLMWPLSLLELGRAIKLNSGKG